MSVAVDRDEALLVGVRGVARDVAAATERCSRAAQPAKMAEL